MAEVALSATLELTEPKLHAISAGVPDVSDATDGNSFVNTGVEVVVVDNTGGSSRTIDFNDENGAAFSPALQVTVLANRMAVIGPFDADIYGDSVTFLTSSTDLHARVFSIARTKNIITA